MGVMDDAEHVLVDDPEEWGRWLCEHHERGEGVWLVRWTAGSGRETWPIRAYTKESLRFGWIDSVPRKTEQQHRTMLWCAPRKPGSGWSALNKQLIEELRAEGRLEPAGEQMIAGAVEDGSWTLLDDVEAGVVPDDLEEAFARHPGSRSVWEGFPRSATRGMLEWVVQAKTSATRSRRVEAIARKAARGERALG